jgi:hypothetical protein
MCVSSSTPEVQKLPYNTGILKREELKEKKLGTTTDVKAFKYKKEWSKEYKKCYYNEKEHQ